MDNTPLQENSQLEHKLILMYLIDKMDMPLSSDQISHFALDGSVMDYFTMRQCLSDMVSGNYLNSVAENNNTRYTITETGQQALDYFEKHIPVIMRNRINKYVNENRKDFKKDYETTANYFKDIHSGYYTVKCGIYEEDSLLMEINLTVVSREQAKLICSNWKQNVNTIYGEILDKLIFKSEDAEEDSEDGLDENGDENPS